MSVNALSQPKLGGLFKMQWEEVQQCHVLLYPEGMVRLNQSAGEIMKRCDGVRTVDEIVVDLESNFGVTGLRQDIIAFLDMALNRGWLVDESA